MIYNIIRDTYDYFTIPEISLDFVTLPLSDSLYAFVKEIFSADRFEFRKDEHGNNFVVFNNVFSKQDPLAYLEELRNFVEKDLGIKNEAMRDFYIGMALSMAGVLKCAKDGVAQGKALYSFVSTGNASQYVRHLLSAYENHRIYEGMILHTTYWNKEFLSYVNWLSMTYSTKTRSAARYMRYMGF